MVLRRYGYKPMATFDKAFAVTVGNEGGYANVAFDAGGETMFGLSRKYNPEWPGWAVVDALKAGTNFPQNVNEDAGLLALAKDWYRHSYWKFDTITNEDVAADCFDVVVNFSSGAKIIQLALSRLGYTITVDGALGSKTMDLLNTVDPAAFVRQLAIESLLANVQDILKHPEKLPFARGWLTRRINTLLTRTV
jgi:lysozyme family protein